MQKCPICGNSFTAFEFMDHTCKMQHAPVKTNNIIGSTANMRLNVENLQAAVYNIKVSGEILEDPEILEIQEEMENLQRSLVLMLNKKYIWK